MNDWVFFSVYFQRFQTNNRLKTKLIFSFFSATDEKVFEQTNDLTGS